MTSPVHASATTASGAERLEDVVFTLPHAPADEFEHVPAFVLAAADNDNASEPGALPMRRLLVLAALVALCWIGGWLIAGQLFGWIMAIVGGFALVPWIALIDWGK